MWVNGKAEKPLFQKRQKSLLGRYKPPPPPPPPPPKILNKLIFSNYARRLDAKFHDEGRKVALIIDNCTGHTNFDKLEAIELVFLPANTTSKTQPMDQGVIRALKAFYHANVVRHQIKHIDAGSYCPWMF